MVELTENFSSDKSETFCLCGERELMSHIYYCEKLSENREVKISHEKICNGDISEQKEILYRFEENFKMRENYKNQIETKEVTENKIMKISPCDPFVDPLLCNKFSNG